MSLIALSDHRLTEPLFNQMKHIAYGMAHPAAHIDDCERPTGSHRARGDFRDVLKMNVIPHIVGIAEQPDGLPLQHHN